MPENEKEVASKDINDIFDDILFSEDKVIQESYSEGFQLGVSKGNPEGYHLGYHRGAELGAEIGYYTGITESYIKYLDTIQARPEKLLKQLENLKVLLEKFPKINAEDADILEEASKIQAKFKKACAQLKIDAPYPHIDNLSF